ncbi:uncharacterized protein METZ01_LOCUS278116, partial [marine metagenome]
KPPSNAYRFFNHKRTEYTLLHPTGYASQSIISKQKGFGRQTQLL